MKKNIQQVTDVKFKRSLDWRSCLKKEASKLNKFCIEEEEGNYAGITLNSLAGVVGVSSIILVGKIEDKEVSFLVDTGVIHNFIDPTIAERLGLK